MVPEKPLGRSSRLATVTCQQHHKEKRFLPLVDRNRASHRQFATWHLGGPDHGYDTRRLDCSFVRSLADMALHGFRQGTVRPPLDRGLVVVGDEPYPHPVFGRPSDRRASAAVL